MATNEDLEDTIKSLLILKGRVDEIIEKDKFKMTHSQNKSDNELLKEAGLLGKEKIAVKYRDGSRTHSKTIQYAKEDILFFLRRNKEELVRFKNSLDYFYDLSREESIENRNLKQQLTKFKKEKGEKFTKKYDWMFRRKIANLPVTPEHIRKTFREWWKQLGKLVDKDD